MCYNSLFKTKLNFSNPLIISYTYKLTSDPSLVSHGCRYFLQLHTNGSPSRVFLDPFSIIPESEEDQKEEEKSSGLSVSMKVPQLPGCVLAPLSAAASSQLRLKFTGSTQEDNSSDWKTKLVLDVEGFVEQRF